MNPFGVCLFCSASVNLPEAYFQLAAEFGTRVGRAGWRLVYGGGGRGLMGSAARAAAAAGGRVLGVMPQVLVRRESLATDIGENLVVETLAERKARMAEAARVFVALPGGIGTLDEVSEMITWNELGIHSKPVLLLNAFGFWDPLIEFFRRGQESGVIRRGFEHHYAVVATLDELFDRLEHCRRASGTG